jgi:predicted Zn finger-like uncharacterized protein
MGKIRIKCPACGATLAVSDDHVKQYVRCGRCKHKFPVARQATPVMEDVVASWLTEEEPEEPQSDAGFDDLPYSTDIMMADRKQAAPPPKAKAPPPSPPPTPPTPTHHGEIRAVKIERRGVLFEFPASRLLDAKFRCAFPRQCMSCEARMHLRAHVVIFAQQLRDSISIEAEHNAGTLVLSNEEVRGLSGEQVLERLPEVPNVPHPGNLPMPYWVCDMCSGSGSVSGQIQVNPATGTGWCRLFIRNLRRAMEFMTSAGGEGNEGYPVLKERIERTAENPWDNLPEVVQHRVQQWFHPRGGEEFIAYVPDRDHVRTEDGMAGVLISTTRLIYHTPRCHYQANAAEPLELEHASARGKGSVSIMTPAWTIRHMTVDRDGITRMRRALTLGKFHAVWR